MQTWKSDVSRIVSIGSASNVCHIIDVIIVHCSIAYSEGQVSLVDDVVLDCLALVIVSAAQFKLGIDEM